MKELLECYHNRIRAYREQIAQKPFLQRDLLTFQELEYRISVLESIRFWLETAPVTTEIRTLGEHYQVVSSYLELFRQERRHDIVADRQHREKSLTALLALSAVIHEGSEKFSRFYPVDAKSYRNLLIPYVVDVLNRWLFYRNLYIDIPKEVPEQKKKQNGIQTEHYR